MSFNKFINDLLHRGQVQIKGSDPPAGEGRDAAAKVIAEFEKFWRLELPSDAPEFLPEAALWAGESFYRGSQLLLFRELPANDILRSLAEQSPASDDAHNNTRTHYSVDIVFRFLPDLLNFASAVADDDPLTDQIRNWCFEWPLSSVGIPTSRLRPLSATEPNDDLSDEVEANRDIVFDIDPFASNQCLMQLYVDRTIDSADKFRAEDVRVADMIRNSAGIYPQLAGPLEKAIKLESNKPNV